MVELLASENQARPRAVLRHHALLMAAGADGVNGVCARQLAVTPASDKERDTATTLNRATADLPARELELTQNLASPRLVQLMANGVPGDNGQSAQ
jgi:hypothetical protein